MKRMLAMVAERPGAPLVARQLPVPEPGPDDVLLRVLACGVCRTDLHVADGELPPLGHPVVPGHEIVGEVVRPGGARDRARAGRPGRRALARLDLRRLRRLPRRAREPLPRGRASPATTATAASPSGPWPTRATPSRCRRAGPGGDRAAALRRADRLPGLADGRRGAAARALRLRRGRPPGGASWRGRAGQEVFAFVRPGDAEARAVRARARRRLGRAVRRAAAGAARRRHPLRAGGGAGAGRARAPSDRAARWSAAASTCPTSRRSPTRCSGASGWCARWPT